MRHLAGGNAFAAMERDAVAGAEVAASWQAKPADAVVTVPDVGPGLTPAALRMMTRLEDGQIIG